MSLNNEVRAYWEVEPCGTGTQITGGLERQSLEWFKEVEQHRYDVEPFIHSVAQFQRHHGKTMLEIGVGAGTDHLQWARAGLKCFGVDLTDAAIETTQKRLSLYGFSSTLCRIDAEVLPFESEQFDLVYSWGVIHHSESPDLIIAEIYRVLKPGGTFVGMMYARSSVGVFGLWVKYALLKGKPWRSFNYINWHHMESVGTKGYNIDELKKMFSKFSKFESDRWITKYDKHRWPQWISHFFPDSWGRYISLRVVK